MGYCICKIPVYRLSPEAFDLETEHILQSLVESSNYESDKVKQGMYVKTKILLSNYKPQFNEIIIWIDIRLISNYILFEVWKRDKKKYFRQQPSEYIYDSARSIELDIRYLRGKSSDEIFNVIISHIRTIYKGISKKRFTGFLEKITLL